jgi:hypothetical protein
VVHSKLGELYSFFHLTFRSFFNTRVINDYYVEIIIHIFDICGSDMYPVCVCVCMRAACVRVCLHTHIPHNMTFFIKTEKAVLAESWWSNYYISAETNVGPQNPS